MNYVTTNIRLLEEDYLRLKEEAVKKRKSLAAVIRDKIGGEKSTQEYAKRLLALKTDWFSYEEYRKNKMKVVKRLRNYSW